MTEPYQGPHHCTGCGQLHGETPPPNPEVEIARVQAERDIEVARIQARQEKGWNETRTEVAEIEAAAEVATAEATAETVVALTGAGGEPDGDEGQAPVVIEAPEPEMPPEEPSLAPADGHDGGEPPAKPKKSGLSYWR